MILTKTLHSYDIRVRAFWTLASIAAIALGFYVYAVLATINHTASRESFLERSQSLSARVSSLEYSYIALKNDLSLDIALSKGYTEVVKPLYVSRSRPTLTLTASPRLRSAIQH